MVWGSTENDTAITTEVLNVVHVNGGWCVVRLPYKEANDCVAGPYGDHADAVQAAQTRAYRLSQGWRA